jgi:hypothetical protein
MDVVAEMPEYESMIQYGMYSVQVIEKLWHELQPAPPVDVMISLMEQLDILVVKNADLVVVPCMIRVSSINDADRFEQQPKRVALKVQNFPAYAFCRLMVQISKQAGFCNATFGTDALSIEYKPPPHTARSIGCVVVVRKPVMQLVRHNEGKPQRVALIAIETSDDAGWQLAIESIRSTIEQQQVGEVQAVVACECSVCDTKGPRCLFDFQQAHTESIEVRCANSKRKVSIIANQVDGVGATTTSALPTLEEPSMISLGVGCWVFAMHRVLMSRCVCIDDCMHVRHVKHQQKGVDGNRQGNTSEPRRVSCKL